MLAIGLALQLGIGVEPAWSGTADAGCRGAEAAVPVPAEVIVSCLASGRAVELRGATVAGNLDLVELADQSVRAPFRCQECRFDGDLVAANVIFRRAVDLSGSTFEGPVVLRGASFESLASFGSTPESVTTFADSVDLSLAAFSGLADFASAAFRGEARFASAAFSGRATFTSARFGAAAKFSAAAFAADAELDSATFAAEADFTGASFRSPADFHQAVFQGTAVFRRADFLAEADHSQTMFFGEAVFRDSRFGADASFVGTRFTGAAEFDAAKAAGRLDFSAAQFLATARFFTTSAGSITFGDARFDDQIVMNGISAGDIELDVAATRLVDGAANQEHVLSLLETTAKARDDLAVANDARFERLRVQSQGYSPLLRAVDWLFYRQVAGYLVRPLHPLLALLVLALTFAAVRQAGGFRAIARAPARPLNALRRLGLKAGIQLANGFWETLSTVKSGTSQLEATRSGALLARRLEVLAYRALLVCFLLALASSNPTLRQMVEAIF